MQRKSRVETGISARAFVQEFQAMMLVAISGHSLFIRNLSVWAARCWGEDVRLPGQDHCCLLMWEPAARWPQRHWLAPSYRCWQSCPHCFWEWVSMQLYQDLTISDYPAWLSRCGSVGGKAGEGVFLQPYCVLCRLSSSGVILWL